jgi:hypothetical protein
MKIYFRLLLGVTLFASLASIAVARSEHKPGGGFIRYDEHTVYYSVFNSTMVTPEIAQLHQITRGEDQMLVNIALVANDSVNGGQAAEVSGSVSNLMQQRRELKFKAIVEDDVVYYLAPLRVTNEEVLNFALEVRPTGGTGRTYQLKFSKKLYVDK